MIYSRWRPDTGMYDYYESAERRGLGDDLPVPTLKGSSPIGVASTDAGRPDPGGLKFVGRGQQARGSILPMSRAGLSGTAQALGLSVTGTDWFLLAAGTAFGWWASTKWPWVKQKLKLK